MPKAVLLLSGGLDPTTLLAVARRDGYDVHAMTFRYGQRHANEIEAARRVAARFGVQAHVVADIDLRTFGGSALTSDSIDVPRDRDVGERGVPVTYVPARNTIFLASALRSASSPRRRSFNLAPRSAWITRSRRAATILTQAAPRAVIATPANSG